MDMKKTSKASYPLALKLTAAAVLGLSAGNALAATTCPAVISSAIWGVCTLSEGSSVTVTNTGSVGGILADGVTRDFIDNQGNITNSTPFEEGLIGINVLGSSSISSIINSGKITARGDVAGGGTLTLQATGIYVDSHSSVASITNSGTISASASASALVTGNWKATATAFGINVGGGVGSITNSGTITATATATATDGSKAIAYGIDVGDNTDGSITNSGTITAGAGAGGGISAYAYGIYVNDNTDGSITNSGRIIASATGDSANAYGIYVENGNGSITNSGTIAASVNGSSASASAYAIYVDNSSAANEINLVGQSSHLIGAVYAPGSTVNVTSGARFTSEGTFDVATFNIESGGFFQMADYALTAGRVNNTGILSVASGVSPTITGNYKQLAGGVYQLGAESASNYGQLQVSGDADLSASGALDVQLSPTSTFVNGTTLAGVLSAGTLTAPGSYAVTSNSFIWAFTGITNGQAVDLTMSINPAAAGACSGQYCTGAVSAIVNQVAAGNAAFSPFAPISTEAAFCTAAQQSTNELNNENIEVTYYMTRAVLDRVQSATKSRLEGGASGGDAMYYEPGKFWLKPYGGTLDQGARNTVQGYQGSAYGVVGGIDKEVVTDVMLGGAFAIGNNKFHGKESLRGQSISTDVYQGIVYVSKYLPKSVYLSGQGLFGYGQNDSKRDIPLYGSTAKASYGSWFTNISGEFGRRYFVNERVMVTPEVNASYIYVNQGRYTEAGSLLSLNVDSNNNSALIFGADLNAAYLVGAVKQHDVSVFGHAGVAYDVLNSQPSSVASFIAGGPSFTTFGIDYNNAVFRGGVGMTIARAKGPLSMNLNYDVQAGNGGYNGIASATIKYKL